MKLAGSNTLGRVSLGLVLAVLALPVSELPPRQADNSGAQSRAQAARPVRDMKEVIVVGVECMHCWYWVSDFCAEHNIDFILGHALYMKAIHGGKAKNDRIDSYKIAHLIRGGNFPLAYVYPLQMRAARDLLRRRTRIVRHGADLKAHVKNTTSQYNLPPNNLNLRYDFAREAMRDCFVNILARTCTKHS